MHRPDNSNEPRLDKVIASYLKAIDAGQLPDRDQLLELNPDLAPALISFFDNHDKFNGFSPNSKPRNRPTPMNRDASTDPVFLRPTDVAARVHLPGDLLAGRYRVLEMKAGGMGQVYLVDDLQTEDLNRQRAIKTFADYAEWSLKKAKNTTRTHYSHALALFRREAIAWIRLGSHDNIVRAWWVLDIGNKPYLVMEYVDGGDLKEWLRDGPLTLQLALRFAVQVCRGLQHAYTTSSLVHCDIKPSNILISRDKIAKIADFGLSRTDVFDTCRVVLKSSSQQPASDERSAVGGTLSYMAPEQFDGSSPVAPQTDMYSFGAMLFEMLTAQQMFRATSLSEHYSLRKTAIPDVRDIISTVPSRLAQVVARCTAYSPAERFPSFDHLARSLLACREPKQSGSRPANHPRIPAESESTRVLHESYSLLSLGKFKEAAACAERGITVSPLDYGHWTNKGKALNELGDIVGASECYEHAATLAPDVAKVWSNIGWTRLQLHDNSGGLSAAERATLLDANLSEAWLCRGTCEHQAGLVSESLKSLKMAADLAPHDWKVHEHLGMLLFDLGRDREAIASFHEAVRINPRRHLCWIRLSSLFQRVGNWEQARATIDRALKIQPGDASAWALRAWCFANGQADHEVARACLTKAVALDPQNGTAQVVRKALAEHGITVPK